MTKRVLGTIKRGKVKITSMKQIKYLEVKKLPYTRFVYRKGKLIKKVRRNVK
jgi:hypothetical protein